MWWKRGAERKSSETNKCTHSYHPWCSIESSSNNNEHGVEEHMVAQFGDLSKLTSLELDVEEIEDASNIAHLGGANIENLSLNVNKLKNLSSLEQLHCIRTLSVKDNKMNSLEGVQNLQNLQSLYADVNKLQNIDTIASASCRFDKLFLLSLNTNSISSLPDNLADFAPNLCSLSLYQNKIDKLNVDTFVNLKSLTSLDLGRNYIATTGATDWLGKCLNNVISLRTLVLSQNDITRPPGEQQFLMSEASGERSEWRAKRVASEASGRRTLSPRPHDAWWCVMCHVSCDV